MSPNHPATPLVSVVIPAYKPTWLRQALQSVQAQTWRALEVVVCDDSREGKVLAIVEAFAATVDFPVHYSRNPQRLWETRSTARAIGLASGEYIKFLHDDDRLHPDCIASMVEAFAKVPEAALVASRRRLVNEAGGAMPDGFANAFPRERDLVIDGADLVDYIAHQTRNFIGEPSAVMCRRTDLLPMGERLSWLGERKVTWVADLALYAKLLRQGPLVMLSRPLVDFRVSRLQFSQAGRDRPGIGNPGHEALRTGLRELGWVREARDPLQVSVRPLDGSKPEARIELDEAINRDLAVAQVQWSRTDWHARRKHAYRGERLARLNAFVESIAPPSVGIVMLAHGATPDQVRTTLVSLDTAPARIRDALHVVVLGAPLPGGEWARSRALPFDREDPAGSVAAAIAGLPCDWITLVEAGSLYLGPGLRQLVLEAAQAEGLQALYTDGWYRDTAGNIAPAMRPAMNLDLLLGNPTEMAPHWVFRRHALLECGAPDPAHADALALDMALRLVEHAGLGAVGHVPEPLLVCDLPRFDEAAQTRALLRHLHARGYADARVASAGRGMYHIDYAHPQPASVSLVVVAPPDLAMLERCVVSVLERTNGTGYELLLVDNGAPPDVSAWLRQVEPLGAGRIRVLALDPPVDAWEARNLAAGQAAGEYLLFLDGEAAVLQADWLDSLLNHGQRPEVGVVGARTVSAEGRITHAGLVPALGHAGGRVFVGRPMDSAGYMGRLQVAHDYTAVSAGCMLVRQELFAALGGFDASAGGGADADFCLRVAGAGYLTVWTPQATLLHVPRDEPEPWQEREPLLQRWLPQLARDPAYNPNLRLDVAGGFELEQAEPTVPRCPGPPVTRLLAQPADQAGSGHYRVSAPFVALEQAGAFDGACVPRRLDVVDVERFGADVLVLQRRVTPDDVPRFERIARHNHCLRVYELDDYLVQLPPRSIHRSHMPANVADLLRRTLAVVDRFVVSTPVLAEAFSCWHPDIRVARNRLDPALWNALPAAKRSAGRPRVGWAGGISHTGDLELIADVVRALAGEVDWVFFGMCPDVLRPYVHEFYPGVPLEQYPRVLASLRLDLALAPLEQNRFNSCKSNLRLLEYGACGYPVVCTDIEPYREPGLPVTRVRNRKRDWVEAIRAHLAEPESAAAAGHALREAVRRDWMLEGDNLDEWRRAWLPD